MNETNIAERQGRYLIKKDSNYIGFWTNADENKIKGSGVGLVINRYWEKHIGQITKFSNYYIDTLLVFKKIKLVIICIYILPNDKEEKKKIQQQVIRRIRECEKNRIWVIVIGDFNDIRNRDIDQNKELSNRKQSLLLLR